MSEPEYRLNDIGESEFQRWKHHPVTKVVMRFLIDYIDQKRRDQVAWLEVAKDPIPPKEQGQYQGFVQALQELVDLEFAIIDAFYSEGEGNQEVDDEA